VGGGGGDEVNIQVGGNTGCVVFIKISDGKPAMYRGRSNSYYLIRICYLKTTGPLFSSSVFPSSVGGGGGGNGG
jgi:hypothetical protein